MATLFPQSLTSENKHLKTENSQLAAQAKEDVKTLEDLQKANQRLASEQNTELPKKTLQELEEAKREAQLHQQEAQRMKSQQEKYVPISIYFTCSATTEGNSHTNCLAVLIMLTIDNNFIQPQILSLPSG